MQKTVNVVDETGNRYEPTYVKRAQGLVKHGRARFIDESTICLTCPPSMKNDWEDKIMLDKEHGIQAEQTDKPEKVDDIEEIEEIEKIEEIENIGETGETGKTGKTAEKVTSIDKLTEEELEEALACVEAERRDLEYRLHKEYELQKKREVLQAKLMEQEALKERLAHGLKSPSPRQNSAPKTEQREPARASRTFGGNFEAMATLYETMANAIEPPRLPDTSGCSGEGLVEVTTAYKGAYTNYVDAINNLNEHFFKKFGF